MTSVPLRLSTSSTKAMSSSPAPGAAMRSTRTGPMYSPPFGVLAVTVQGGLGLAVLGRQRHAGAAHGAQGASGAAALPAKELVGDAAEAVQALGSLLCQRDARLAADLADAGPAVRVNVEGRVSRIASGERLGPGQMRKRLRGQALPAAVNGRGHVAVVPVPDAEASGHRVHGVNFVGVICGDHDAQVERDAGLAGRSQSFDEGLVGTAPPGETVIARFGGAVDAQRDAVRRARGEQAEYRGAGQAGPVRQYLDHHAEVEGTLVGGPEQAIYHRFPAGQLEPQDAGVAHGGEDALPRGPVQPGELLQAEVAVLAGVVASHVQLIRSPPVPQRQSGSAPCRG